MEQTAKQFRKRNAILACLKSTDTHPSADWIFQQLRPQIPDLSLGTVYRNLNLFKEQGLAVSLGTVKGVERFDGTTQPHVHFVCTCCGRVDDLPGIQIPEELNAAVSRDSGGRVDNCQLTFTGCCTHCLP